MAKIPVNMSNRQIKNRIESIAREYSIAVIEGTENGCDYPEASVNLRFLNDLIFEITCLITDSKTIKKV